MDILWAAAGFFLITMASRLEGRIYKKLVLNQ